MNLVSTDWLQENLNLHGLSIKQSNIILTGTSLSLYHVNVGDFISVFVDKDELGMTILSGISAMIAFLLAIVSYLKLDAQSEAHKTSAHQYDKLQSMCEFSSGYFLLSSNRQSDKKYMSKNFLKY